MSHAIDVTIAGQAYKFSVAPEHEADLRAAAELVDSQMARLKSQSSAKGGERIAVMTALSLASDLMKAQASSQLDTASATSTATNEAVSAKIAAMNSRLENALQAWGVNVVSA